MDSKEAKNAPGLEEAKDGTSIFTDASYAQTYVVLKDNLKGKGAEAKTSEGNEVLFACGNWCYRGQIQFNNLKIVLSELPILIPTLQRQQSSLRYFCNSSAVPQNCPFYEPMKFMEQSAHFYAKEMTSIEVENELEKLSKMFPWLDDSTDGSLQYFELELESVPEYMEDVAIIANKTYVHGLIIISVYFKGMLYYLIKDGEGDQALLDVRFPDVTKKGQGMHLASYTANNAPYKKLTLWNMLGGAEEISVKVKDIPKVNTLSMSTTHYQQTYCILRSAWGTASPVLNIHHDALFRFGSWCYAGRVQLTPSIALADVPFVIPALRMQQSRLEYLCNVDKVPTTSPFANALDYLHSHHPIIEEIILESTDTLEALIDRLSKMGLGDSVSKWLDGDATNSFFEFKLEPDQALRAAFETVEMIASKMYYASGIVTTCIFFEYTLYLCVGDASNENPLLDSKFPDVSGKGRGYQISSYESGHPQWPALKKVSIWQTVGALEQEFRERASNVAEAKLSGTAINLDVSLDESQGSSSYPQHQEGKDWHVNNDPKSIANIGGGETRSKIKEGVTEAGSSTLASMNSEVDYDGDGEGPVQSSRLARGGFDLRESEAKRIREFEADAAARNLSDLKSIGGRINSFNNAQGGLKIESEAPSVAESKHAEECDQGGVTVASSKAGGELSPVQGANAAGGNELTPVRGVELSNHGLGGGTQTNLGAEIGGDEDIAQTDALVTLQGASSEDLIQAADSASRETFDQIESLNKAQAQRSDRDKDLLHKQEEASVAAGTSYLDRTPTGGMKDLGHSLAGRGGKAPGGESSSGSNLVPIQFGKGSMGTSRPHHLPKMSAPAGLSGKLESIKLAMGSEMGAAPWDTKTGKPLQAIGGNDTKK